MFQLILLLSVVYILTTLNSADAAITAQYRHTVTFDLATVLSHGLSRETATGSEIQCAATTAASELYCYRNRRCIAAPVSIPSIVGSQEDGWRCKVMTCMAPFIDANLLGCIAVVTTAATYPIAKTSCPGQSLLVSPATDNLYQALVSRMSQLYNSGAVTQRTFFVGIERIGVVWTWLDGHTLSATGALWATGQPDNDRCAVLEISSGTAPLWDRSCTSSYSFICQK